MIQTKYPNLQNFDFISKVFFFFLFAYVWIPSTTVPKQEEFLVVLYEFSIPFKLV